MQYDDKYTLTHLNLHCISQVHVTHTQMVMDLLSTITPTHIITTLAWNRIRNPLNVVFIDIQKCCLKRWINRINNYTYDTVNHIEHTYHTTEHIEYTHHTVNHIKYTYHTTEHVKVTQSSHSD